MRMQKLLNQVTTNVYLIPPSPTIYLFSTFYTVKKSLAFRTSPKNIEATALLVRQQPYCSDNVLNFKFNSLKNVI
jgi:hypothetical protein